MTKGKGIIFIPSDKRHPCSCGYDALSSAYEAFK